MEPSEQQRAEYDAFLKRRRRELTWVAGVASVAGFLALLGGEIDATTGIVLIALVIGTALAIEFWGRPHWRDVVQTPDAVPPQPLPVLAVQEPGLGQKARVLLDELPDAILVLDEEGRLVLANRAACARFVGNGYERKFLSSLMRRPAVLEVVPRVRETLKAEEVEFSDLVPVERSFTAYVAPLLDANGPTKEILVVVRDITGAKAVEKMRADFVANASHELRTPLSSLIGFIETLRGHARDDESARERFLAIMGDQASRMGRLIDDLLSLSRIELNEHVAPQDVVELGGIVKDVIDAMQPLAREAQITLATRVDDDLPAVIGSRDELVQVLQNLLDNAIKYGRPKSRVEVSAATGHPGHMMTGLMGASCYVSVSDQGEGIAREHIPRLTERFYRVDVKRSRERGGTGLGLAIVKHIVSRHRGRMHIKSDPGEGSVFTVLLPQASPAPVEAVSGDIPATSAPPELPGVSVAKTL